MSKRWQAVTVGEIYIDHVFSGLGHWPEPGEEVFTPDYLRELGGGAAITACGLGRLGRHTAVFGVIGAEERDWVMRRFDDFGVNRDYLRAADGSSGVTVSVSVGAERSFYSYAGANVLLSGYLQSPAIAEELRQAAHVHFAVPLERSVAQRLLPLLKAAGCSTSLDVGWQPEWQQRAENLETCREVDYFLPNEREARWLTGREDSEEMMRRLAEIGLGHAILKLGPRGAMALDHGRVLQVSCPRTEVVDTTGAGDAFDAGLIDAILDHAPKEIMLERASACGSLSTRKAGALRALATRQELEASYDEPERS